MLSGLIGLRRACPICCKLPSKGTAKLSKMMRRTTCQLFRNEDRVLVARTPTSLSKSVAGAPHCLMAITKKTAALRYKVMNWGASSDVGSDISAPAAAKILFSFSLYTVNHCGLGGAAPCHNMSSQQTKHRLKLNTSGILRLKESD